MTLYDFYLAQYDFPSEYVLIEEYSVDPDFPEYPMTEAEIGEFHAYEAMAYNY